MPHAKVLESSNGGDYADGRVSQGGGIIYEVVILIYKVPL